MQISIYLDDRLVREVDREAKIRKKTRSKLIQSIIRSVLKVDSDKKKSPWEKAFGMLKNSSSSAESMLEHIHSNRKNRKWE